jgi:uncharacterized protein
MALQGIALITGASAGIGREYTLQLARRGCNVVITARRADRLEELARSVRAETRRDAIAIPADLASTRGRGHLLSELQSREIVPDLLVNNAGRGYFGAAFDAPSDASLQMLRLNVESLTMLTLEIGRRMAARGSGGIINIGSTAAYQPLPYFSVYAATKAYVASFSEALSAELSGSGVRVFTVAPGPTQSEFGAVAGLPAQFQKGGTPAADLVRRSLDAYEHQMWGDTYVDGWLNAAGALLGRIAPRFLVTHVAAGLLRGK